MLKVGALCRAFLFGANATEVKGQEAFLKLLESRRDYNARTRGLITGMYNMGLGFIFRSIEAPRDPVR